MGQKWQNPEMGVYMNIFVVLGLGLLLLAVASFGLDVTYRHLNKSIRGLGRSYDLCKTGPNGLKKNYCGTSSKNSTQH